MVSLLSNISFIQARRLSYKSIISWYAGLVKSKPHEAPFNHIIQIGDPTLRTTSQEIPRHLIKSDEVKFLIKRMEKVMQKYNCVGLAAPQLGIPFRLFLIQFSEKQLNYYKPQEREVKEMQVVPLKVKIHDILLCRLVKVVVGDYQPKSRSNRLHEANVR